MLKSILFVGLGSFVGGSLRYVVGRWLPAFAGHGFPYATLAVNLVGCLLIGFFYGLFERGQLLNPHLRLFLTVGICGGFTTFSTFVNENFHLLRNDNVVCMFGYLSLSVLGGFALLYLGYTLAKLL